MASLAAAVAGLIGALVGALGLYLSRKGQARTESADQVAAMFKASHQIIEDLEKSVDRKDAEIERKNNELTATTQLLMELRSLVAGQIVAAAVSTSVETPGDEDAEIERIREFLRTMKEI